MKASEITIGQSYLAKVGGRIVPLKVTGTFEWAVGRPIIHGIGTCGATRSQAYRTGWLCVSQMTGREIRVRSAQRFRAAATTTTEV